MNEPGIAPVTVFQYRPAWTVPCISPFVTKVLYYLRLTGIPHVAVPQDLTRLDRDSPTGKLPTMRDVDGTLVADSGAIIGHLKATRGDLLDHDASSAERAQMLAWTRLIDEHLYWLVVVQPRWRETAGWERYLRIIAGTDDVPPGLRAFADDFRFRILNEFMHGGWGRLDASAIYARARQDVDALADFLGDKPYFMGERLRSVDAAVLSILRHIVDAPFDFDTRAHAGAKPNLRAYMDRMRDRHGL